MSLPPVDRTAPAIPRLEREIVASASTLGLGIPDACVPGVVANLALLDGHADILLGRQPRDDA